MNPRFHSVFRTPAVTFIHSLDVKRIVGVWVLIDELERDPYPNEEDRVVFATDGPDEIILFRRAAAPYEFFYIIEEVRPDAPRPLIDVLVAGDAPRPPPK